MTDGLLLADDLELPLEVVVEATAIVGKRGRGKTFSAKRLVEQSLLRQVTAFVIDPTDVWYGLASGADGSAKGGLDVVVIGGKNGDLPLLPAYAGTSREVPREVCERTGKMLARLVLEGTSIVLVTKGLIKASRRRIVAAALTELYDRAEGTPILVVIDEADEYAPEGAKPIGNRQDDPLVLCAGAVEDIVRRGRAGGLGSLLITQRVAVLSKNVLEQSDTLIALGVTGLNDITAVEKWIAKHASDVETSKRIVASLPGLPRGSAIVWSPEHDILRTVEVLPITTYDSSRSPKVGEIITTPKARRKLDLAALGEEMERFAEEVKAEDPAEIRKAHAAELRDLRTRIADLERELADRPAAEPVEVKVPVLEDVTLTRVDALCQLLSDVAKQAGEIGDEITAAVNRAGELSRTRPASDSARPVAPRQRRPEKRADPPVRREPDRPAVPRAETTEGLSKSQEAILDALAWFESVRIKQPTRGQVAFQSGVSPKSSGFEKNCSTLRTRGLIAYPGPNRLGLSYDGRAIAQPPSVPPTSESLQESIKARLSESQRTMITVLVDAFPNDLTREELADRCGVSVQSSGFEKKCSTLRGLGLADYPSRGTVAATELLFID